jgi:hypothetical protein
VSRALVAVILALAFALSGCDLPLRTEYGWSRGLSLNGTSALVRLLRARGHEVRSLTHLNAAAFDAADAVVRFAPYVGPPDAREWTTYVNWLAQDSDRRLIYVPRDYEADLDYWDAVLAGLPASSVRERERATRLRDQARQRPTPPRVPIGDAGNAGWFAIEPGPAEPVDIAELRGPWAVGIDPEAAGLTRHDVLRDDSGGAAFAWLTGPGSDLVLEYDLDDIGGGQALIVANGSFLLNAALLNRERRPLAIRVVDWLGVEPRSVVFVEGSAPWKPSEADDGNDPRGLALWSRWDRLRWVAGHLIAFAVLACLAAAVRLGRPRPEPPTGLDRPSAHAEALGDLFAGTRDRDSALAILDAYRRWRHPRGRAGPS